MFILFCIFINILMSFQYCVLFGNYSFENKFLDFFNKIIISFAWVNFPFMFFVIYFRKYDSNKKITDI